jgi:hypothetical protein
MSRSRFHDCGEEMVKGAAMETVLLLRQCPLSVAENYAVAVRDMNAALLEKVAPAASQGELQTLKLPPPSPSQTPANSLPARRGG